MGELCLELDAVAEQEYERMRQVLLNRLDINMTTEDLVQYTIKAFIENRPYVSLFGLTTRLKFTLTDVKKIEDLYPDEEQALEYLKTSVYRNKQIKNLVSSLREQLAIGIDLIPPHGENTEILDLWAFMQNELNTRYSSMQFRSGYKSLIVKSAIINMLMKKDHFF